MRNKKKPLSSYTERRDIKKSGEPAGKVVEHSKPIFVVQKHNASHLHYDFRLAIDGVLVSWAVPKGIPRRAGVKRLAVRTEDHPLAYATFEGTIPKGNYGAGTVKIWDHGSYATVSEKNMAQQLAHGKIEFTLDGELLNGTYVLVQMKGPYSAQPSSKSRYKDKATKGKQDSQHWLLMKERRDKSNH